MKKKGAPLHSWLLAILGVAVLAAASLPLWAESAGLHPPSIAQAILLAALGIGFLALAAYFVRRERSPQAQQRAAAARRAALKGELVSTGVLADFVESTRVAYLRLGEIGGEPDAFASSFGGQFYVPPGFAWPEFKERPMWPLAQLNFAELPHLDGFPDRGILQFFINTDDLYGVDFDNRTEQTGFRVVYHPEPGEVTLPNPELPHPATVYLPVERPIRVSASPATMPMSVWDWRFAHTLAESWRRRVGSEPDPELAYVAWDVLTDVESEVIAAHQIGGYAQFTQEDPREYESQWRGHSTVLLQIDSGDGICWGDAGIACFLIEPERLRNLDFSNVLYSWDCS